MVAPLAVTLLVIALVVAPLAVAPLAVTLLVIALVVTPLVLAL